MRLPTRGGAVQRISMRTRPSLPLTGTHRRDKPLLWVVVGTFFMAPPLGVVHLLFTKGTPATARKMNSR